MSEHGGVTQLPEEAFINSIVGEGTRFKGEFDLNGLLRIDGDFNGTVRTKGKVLVGKNGRAECSIFAGTVVVGGVVRGKIIADEKVVVLSTGIILGSVQTPRLIIEEGVVFNGDCRVQKTTAAPTVGKRVEAEPAGGEAERTHGDGGGDNKRSDDVLKSEKIRDTVTSV